MRRALSAFRTRCRQARIRWASGSDAGDVDQAEAGNCRTRPTMVFVLNSRTKLLQKLSPCQDSSCNKQLEEVIDLHDNKNELECYACQYGYDNAGNIYPNSNKKCSLPSVDRVDTIKCPGTQRCLFHSSLVGLQLGWVRENDYKGCKHSDWRKFVAKLATTLRAKTTTPARTLATRTRWLHNEDSVATLVRWRLTPWMKLSVLAMPPVLTTRTRHLQECDTDETYCRLGAYWLACLRTTGLFGFWFKKFFDKIQEPKVVRSCSECCQKLWRGNYAEWSHVVKTARLPASLAAISGSVAAYFDSGKAQESCYTCKFIENEDGSIDGNVVVRVWVDWQRFDIMSQVCQCGLLLAPTFTTLHGR